MDSVEALRQRVYDLEGELRTAKQQLQDLETSQGSLAAEDDQNSLTLDEYRRYGRQMILERFGLGSQLKLKTASVLVIGAGGLGCPALQYLAAAGVGTLGIVDHDVVELSNLQRQILHTDARIGMLKAISASVAIKSINPSAKTVTYTTLFDSSNALVIMKGYDLVLDCTDNPSTRYLISDVSRALGIPLVSGAAMRYDGQLCVYNHGERGPCYRCIFPSPPKPETVGTCEDVGVLGVVTGIVGTLQATEAVKLLTAAPDPDQKPTMLLYSALSSSAPFRSVKLRSRRPACPTCSLEPDGLSRKITKTDYVSFCGGAGENARLAGERDTGSSRITPQELKSLLYESNGSSTDDKSSQPTLIDVRPAIEFGICHLPNSTNIPLKQLVADPRAVLGSDTSTEHTPNVALREILIICRQGNDSQVAVSALRNALHHDMGCDASQISVRDVRGGLFGWHRTVDPHFPIY